MACGTKGGCASPKKPAKKTETKKGEKKTKK
jgi:hypothetical protein